MAQKKPKTEQFTSFEVKKAINAEDPAKYKDMFVSWQISKIDLEGEWGLNFVRNFTTLSVTDVLIDELISLGNPNSSDVTDALAVIDKKKFDSLDQFLLILLKESKGNITSKEQSIIIKHLEENFFWSEIFPKLSHFENTTWTTLEKELYGKERKTKHHTVSVEKIGKSAQKRLSELRLDDVDDLFSIRLDGKFRIWGIRKYSYLQIIWIDPDHSVYPV